MLSRVADSLYWLGRYSERLQTNAYITNVQINQMLEQGLRERQYEQQWKIVLSICGYMDDYEERFGTYNLHTMLRYLLIDEQNFNSISSLIENIRTNAKNTRDCIPNELFEEWNSLYFVNKEMPNDEEYTVLKTTDFLQSVRKTSLTATGIIDSLMTRDEGFQFIKIGKWLERSEKTALILMELLGPTDGIAGDVVITTGLQLTNTLEEYTRRTRQRESDTVLNFLVGDNHCSRAVAYGIRKIKKTLLDLEGEKVRPYATELFEAIEELEELVGLDAHHMTADERIIWVGDIHEKCMQLGPIFSKTYYLTAPILVK